MVALGTVSSALAVFFPYGGCRVLGRRYALLYIFFHIVL
jgi:hypothetical protein